MVNIKFRITDVYSMSFTEDEFDRIIDAMSNGERKLEEVREQRDELFEANKRLVELVKKMEVALEESEGGNIEFEDREYSFEDGWMPTKIIHDLDLDVGSDMKIEDVDDQIDEVIETMRRIQNLNKEKQ